MLSDAVSWEDSPVVLNCSGVSGPTGKVYSSLCSIDILLLLKFTCTYMSKTNAYYLGRGVFFLLFCLLLLVN